MEQELVQKAAMFVSANILRPRKQKISNVVMLTLVASQYRAEG